MSGKMNIRSSRRKEKYGHSSEELFKDNVLEGTSARTRPFSFDEIMLQRKNKKLSEDVKDATGEDSSISKKLLDAASDHLDSDRAHGHKYSAPDASVHAPVESTRFSSRRKEEKSSSKEDNLDYDRAHGHKYLTPGALDHGPEESMRFGSRKKEEKPYMKEVNLAKGNNRGNLGLENKLKAKPKDDQGRKAKNDRHKDRGHNRMKKDWSSGDSESDFQTKHLRHPMGKDRYPGKGRDKSEIENKRKHRSGDYEKYKDKSTMKKHNPGNWQNSEFLGRKDVRESSPFRYEESRTKRRRSRSREHVNSKIRRSTSLSPRTHRYPSYHGREHGDLSTHTVNKKIGRQQSDIDRSRISTNGSTGHYRRHGVSSSGLGGYSPRKRRSEAAVKTPSPIKRSPEKKSVGWDLPPAGTDSSLADLVSSGLESSNLTLPSNVKEFPGAVPVTSNATIPISVPFSSSSLTKGAAIDAIQLTQATRPMRRLYVENIPASASENSLMECFNNFLMSSGSNHILGTKPCISCIIHKEKGHAFVEFITPEDASAALLFDNRSFFGSNLKIRRPKNFVEVTTGVQEKSVAPVDAISDIVVDSPHKIFIGGISEAMSSEMIIEIVSAFGPLKAYTFQFNDNLRGPCAFLEYVDHSVTLKACAGLNGMKVGGQVLTVVQAFPEALLLENTENPPFYGVPDVAKPLLEKPTQVLKLINVFNKEILSSMSDTEVEEMLEDVRLECARFGTVKSIDVVKHNQSACEVADNVGSAGTSHNVKHDINHDNNEQRMALEEGKVPDFGVISRVELEPSGNNVEEPKQGVDKIGSASHNGNDKAANGHSMGEQCELGRTDSKISTVFPTVHNTDATSGEITSQMDTITDQAECRDEKIDHNNIRTKDLDRESSLPSEGLNLETEGVDPEASSAIDGRVKLESSVVEKVYNKEQVGRLDDCLEVGSVLVEYKRTEASSMAAHCLHGRAFDNRIVAVSYVAPVFYRARFPGT